MMKIVQNAYVALSLEEKCAQLYRDFGIGPFVLASDLELHSHIHRGQPSDPIRLDAAFAQSGDLNIEVIQVRSTGPSAISDMLGADGEGLHHVAYFCDDYRRERDRLVHAGYPVASEFTLGEDLTISFIDTRHAFGHMVELYPRHEALLGLYEQVGRLRDGWDGKKLFFPW